MLFRTCTVALGGVLTFFFHHDTDFPEVLEFTHSTSKAYG